MFYDGLRYPKLYPSQMVVRRRKAWCDRGFNEQIICRNNMYVTLQLSFAILYNYVII